MSEDIVVRVPKDQVDHFWNDKASGDGQAYWQMRNSPRYFGHGGTIYFQFGNTIKAKVVCHTVEYPIWLEDKQQWVSRLWWDCDAVETLDELLAGLNVRQGFAYYEPKEV